MKQQDSKYQIAIYETVQNTNLNICVQATAGAGKTTTLLRILDLLPKFKKTVFLSFSNTIVNELKSRIPVHATASTIHSLGCRMIFARYRGIKVVEDKWFKIFLRVVEEDQSHNQDEASKLSKKQVFKFCYEMQDIMNFARMTCAKFDIESLSAMCDYYSIEYSDQHFKYVIQEFNKERPLTEIDFTDMLYLPVKLNLVNTQYDYILLDEAQDLNNIQRLLLEKIMKPDGRLIAVGDEKQSIYSFSGSSIDSFKKLQERKNTVTLPLSISYRCAKNIVKKAQEIYPEAIEYFEQAQDGEVRFGHIEEIREGDLVVCRKTVPLISVFFQLLQRHIKAQIIGKDIETGLLNLAEKVQSDNHDKTLEKCQYELLLVEQELKEKNISKPKIHPKYISTVEKVNVLEVILNNIGRSEDLVSTIKTIFNDNKSGVKLMTIHRSKGLENDRVFVIEKYNGDIQCPSPKATKDWEKIQEKNLLFVAYTRAKKQLIQLSVVDVKSERILA